MPMDQRSAVLAMLLTAGAMAFGWGVYQRQEFDNDPAFWFVASAALFAISILLFCYFVGIFDALGEIGMRLSGVNIPLDIDIQMSVMASGTATFTGEDHPGHMFNFHTVTLTNREKKPIPIVRMFFGVTVEELTANIPASASCQQEALGAVSVRNLTTGVLPHMPADIRLEPNVPLRGHTEFVIHPMGLPQGAVIGREFFITVTDVMRDRSKTINYMTGEVVTGK